MNNPYSLAIAEAVRQTLTEDKWQFSFNEEQGIFRFGYSPDGHLRNLRYVLAVHKTDFNVYCQLPLGVIPEDRRSMIKMETFLFKASCGLRSGSFELDYDSGGIRFKTYVDCEGLERPTKDMIINSIYCPFVIARQYEAGLGVLLFADASPEEALFLCEQEQEQPPAAPSRGPAPQEEGDAEFDLAEEELILPEDWEEDLQ